MILLGNFLIAVGQLLSSLVTLFIFLLIARAILSWVNPDPSNFIVRIINDTTEPLMARVRPRIPNFGVLDMSIIVVLFGLYFLQSFIAQSMVEYGYVMKRSSIMNDAVPAASEPSGIY
ncbi:MAG: YggT family protein [Bdellovibrionales bacterium]|nr:YggT family protein [Bdellovibrionales bacterium]